MTVRQAFSGVGDWGQFNARPETLELLKKAVPGVWTASTGTFRNMIKLEADKPAPAVVNIRKVYMVHPTENRNISLAEAASLQGFPPSYKWEGTKTDIAQMVANAMPGPLAESIAGSLAGVVA